MNALLKIDHTVSRAIHRAASSHKVIQKLSEIGASGLLFMMFGMLVVSASGMPAKELDTVSIAFAVVGALMLVAPAWATTLVLEYAIKRKRPYEVAGEKLGVPMLWYTPSFPSGHATVAFAIAGVSMLAGLASWPLFVALAAVVAMCRVAVGVHYLSDILVGACIGWFVILGVDYVIIQNSPLGIG